MDFSLQKIITRSHLNRIISYLFIILAVTTELVATYSADQVSNLRHNFIEKFDIIETSDIVLSRSVSTRNTDKQLLHDPIFDRTNELDIASPSKQSSPAKRVQFSSLGRKFNLILSKPDYLITRDFQVVSLDSYGNATIVPYNQGESQILDGFVEGEAKSSATASFSGKEKLMTAHIKTNQDTIIVEPTYLHKENLLDTSNGSNSKLFENTMIAYNLHDHRQFYSGSNNSDYLDQLFKPDELCGGLNMSDPDIVSFSSPTDKSPVSPELEDVFKIYNPKLSQKTRRPKRGIEYFNEYNREKSRCTLHLVADYLFYKHVGKGDLQTTINYLLALVNRVNQIYLQTVWRTGDELDTGFTNIGFTVQNITIHQEYTRHQSDDMHYNMQTDQHWSAKTFLDNFSKYSPPRHYCLAHLFTYRQFDSPVLGLAYVASERYGTIGGICSPTQQKGDAFHKHNTGISTSKGINGETLITRQADLVVAHELGHNMGAEHDSNECRPPPSKGGAYLMHPFAVIGFDKNNRFLSNCSRLSIGRVIRKKASTCFVSTVDHVCGNGIVEDDEECDGGSVGLGHHDPCCDSSCRFTPGSQCSDRHNLCCNKCQITPAYSIKCREAEEFNCKQASFCDGRSADCPASAPVEDETTCVGRGICRGGECMPFCEARKLHSCLCDTPRDACKLCCKISTNSTCVPYNYTAPPLQDGVLCYRGVCEKGRCEQPVQDVVERLWDILEDVNFTTIVRLLRDNIIIVVLVISVPLWLIACHYINEYDRKIKQDVINAIIKNKRRRTGPPGRSPFLPRLFVGDEISNSNSAEDVQLKDESRVPLKPPHTAPLPHSMSLSGNNFEPQVSLEPGFRPPSYGFKLPEGEEVVFEPRGAIALNSIEIPRYPEGTSAEATEDNTPGEERTDPITSYSTEV